jgi:hypothetical protein
METGIHPLLAAMISFLELTLAIGLVGKSSVDRSLAWGVSAFLGVVFLCNLIWKRLLGSTNSNCGCLGFFEVSYLPDWAIVGEFVLLLAFSVSAVSSFPVSLFPIGKWLAINGLTSCFLGFAFAFVSNLNAREDLVSLFVPRSVNFLTATGAVCKEIDVGTVPAASTFKVQVGLLNSGSRPVRIIGNKQSCRCARVVSSPEVLEPGQTEKAEIEYESPSEPGSQSVMVTMYLDEPNQHKVSAALNFQVVSER